MIVLYAVLAMTCELVSMSETVLIHVPQPSLFIGYVSVLPVRVSLVEVFTRVQLLYQLPVPDMIESVSVDHWENDVFCEGTPVPERRTISSGTVLVLALI